MSELVLDVGLVHKLKQACIRNGVTVADLDRLCEADLLAQHRKVKRNHSRTILWRPTSGAIFSRCPDVRFGLQVIVSCSVWRFSKSQMESLESPTAIWLHSKK
jgi:hypothetical protein